MGRFTYEGSVKADFEDRLLAHLQVVIATKLRRGEPFLFSWKDDISLGGGRTAVWVHAHAFLVFKFHGSRSPQLNREWLSALARAANSPEGLYAMREPSPHATHDPDRATAVTSESAPPSADSMV